MVPRGLESVTVAPGRTAPELSAIVPPIAPTPWAIAGVVQHARHTSSPMLVVVKNRTVMTSLSLGQS